MGHICLLVLQGSPRFSPLGSLKVEPRLESGPCRCSCVEALRQGHPGLRVGDLEWRPGGRGRAHGDTAWDKEPPGAGETSRERGPGKRARLLFASRTGGMHLCCLNPLPWSAAGSDISGCASKQAGVSAPLLHGCRSLSHRLAHSKPLPHWISFCTRPVLRGSPGLPCPGVLGFLTQGGPCRRTEAMAL